MLMCARSGPAYFDPDRMGTGGVGGTYEYSVRANDECDQYVQQTTYEMRTG